MRKEERERFAEEWVDAVLKNYSAEPRLGFEARILAKLRTEEQRPRLVLVRSWQMFAVAAACALVVLGVGVWRHSKLRNTAQHGRTSEAARSVPASQEKSVAKQNLENDKNPVLAQHSRKSPKVSMAHTERKFEQMKRDQFPTPAPLSADEQRLLAYVRNTPKSEVVLLAQAQEERQKRAEMEAQKLYVEGMK